MNEGGDLVITNGIDDGVDNEMETGSEVSITSRRSVDTTDVEKVIGRRKRLFKDLCELLSKFQRHQNRIVEIIGNGTVDKSKYEEEVEIMYTFLGRNCINPMSSFLSNVSKSVRRI